MKADRQGMDETGKQDPISANEQTNGDDKRAYICDRCGFEMVEIHCKVVCPNCGSRYDCSDLNIYFG